MGRRARLSSSNESPSRIGLRMSVQSQPQTVARRSCPSAITTGQVASGSAAIKTALGRGLRCRSGMRPPRWRCATRVTVISRTDRRRSVSSRGAAPADRGSHTMNGTELAPVRGVTSAMPPYVEASSGNHGGALAGASTPANFAVGAFKLPHTLFGAAFAPRPSMPTHTYLEQPMRTRRCIEGKPEF